MKILLLIQYMYYKIHSFIVKKVVVGEWSNPAALGAVPQGRGFEPLRLHFLINYFKIKI